MLMQLTWKVTQFIIVQLVVMTMISAAWGEENTSPEAYPSYPSESQSTYQSTPGPTPSGNIIGYKPIPSSALESAMLGVAPAPAQARPAYPVAGQDQAMGYAAPAPAQGGIAASGGAATSELPIGYLTGIVGEGFYTLGRDDVIHINVRNQPEFTGSYAVGYDGRIQYNYLGDIPVAGMTKYEVQQILEKMLSRYVRVPAVNVTILAYNSKVVYVIGEVNGPGKFIMRGDAIKLREAILAAGLPTSLAALTRVHVIKPDLDDPKVRVINIKRILYQGKLRDDVDLTSGEIVVVPSTVLSAVNRFLSGLLSPVTRAGRFAALAAL